MNVLVGSGPLGSWRTIGTFTIDGQLVRARPGAPQVTPVMKMITARFLSVEERIEIADSWRARTPVREIARRLGRSPSTISRELRRNAHPTSGDYRPWAAQERSARRRARPKRSKIAANPELKDFIARELRPRKSMPAGQQQEHERPGAPVLPEGHRPFPPQRRGSGGSRG